MKDRGRSRINEGVNRESNRALKKCPFCHLLSQIRDFFQLCYIETDHVHIFFIYLLEGRVAHHAEVPMASQMFIWIEHLCSQSIYEYIHNTKCTITVFCANHCYITGRRSPSA
jgi:hypothetical protein